MSHTTQIETKEFGDITIHHNSDWSGIVKVAWVEQVQGVRTTKSADIPGEILTSLSLSAATDIVTSKIIAALET